jgi:hypothetical protein
MMAIHHFSEYESEESVKALGKLDVDMGKYSSTWIIF